MKRHRMSRISIAATAITAVLGLTSCATAPTSQSGEGISGTIGYSYWGGTERAEKVNEIIGLFEEQHPGVTVAGDTSQHTAYQERTTVRAAGGGLSCALGMQSTFAGVYIDYEQLRPLDDLIESGQIDVSHIPQQALEAGQIDGEQYVIPTGTFVRPLTYNQHLVEEAGVAPPPESWTWEQYGDWLKELQQGLPEGVYAAELEGVMMFTLTSWVVGHGEEMFTEDGLGFDRELLVEFFDFWNQLTADGVTTPPSSIPQMFGAVELMPMATGQAVSATKDIPHIAVTEAGLAGTDAASEVGWTNAPSDSQSSSGNVLGINGISIPSSCQNVDTAAAFIDFFTNDPEATTTFQSDNGIVTNTESQELLLNDPETPEGVVESIEILQEMTANNELSTTTYPAAYSSLTRELQRQYESVAFGRVSVEEAADEFFDSADYLIN